MSTSTSTSAPDAMDVASSPGASVPSHVADRETNGKPANRPSQLSNNDRNAADSSSNMPAPPTAASSTVHQPKIVQTAFIHKLYKARVTDSIRSMLEDSSIQHLISWSSNAESFVMSPTADFSKVLSQYFKHTNISSFVRQLNMYGFHKERDVFHTGNPDTTLWEFKHGNGSFKRGDIAGLRDIKRRASRHALVHRETNFTKPSSSQPGTPAEPLQIPPESIDARLSNLENTLYDVSARLQRSEENAHYMHLKNQTAMEMTGRLLHFNQELARAIISLVPLDSAVQRDVMSLQAEIQRQAEMIRTVDEPLDVPFASRQQYFGNVDNAPVSPGQLPQDDTRRPVGGLAVPQSQARGQPLYRPGVPSGLALGARRPYGSIGGGSNTQSSPLRNAAAPPPPGPHPLSNMETPPGNLARRHTTADIRAHGWQPTPSSFSASNAPPGPWPSSPGRVASEDQRIRDSLSTYSLQTASHSHPHSRPTTPPPPHAPANGGSNGANTDAFGGWSWNSGGNRDTKGSLFKDSSAPQTRRGSMAHILNPSDTAERSDEDEDPRGDDDRKRKRMQ
ncbi:flocculation suppression protein [Metarhizium album ARSEF 1941]|uniref:Flocculation suppression protein n=1 Tax=Metarhizium album (strain ARSEF 1941) TaxID=1081103 RepID=A0A0B2WT21_METAS|nr:flocculation suppression protein [Metarhizium album ARSEF 1941]KHN99221.1 flocculation suppression protein [Metarhizium album ARSEF 1941]